MLSSHSGAVAFPESVRYRCDTGFSVDSSAFESKRKFHALCKEDGELAGMMSCQKVSCGTPHVFPFTDLTEPETSRRSIEYEDKAKYRCQQGYTLTGRPGGAIEFQVKCQ